MSKTLLVIGSVWPEPTSSAAGRRMMELIAMFQSDGYAITFATACAKSDNAFNLSSIGVTEKEILLNHSSFDDFITSLNPSIVLFDRFMTEEQFGWRVTEQCPNALRILDTEDLHCLRKGRHQALKDSQPFDISYLFNDTAKREIASIYRCDVSLIISEVEMQILEKNFKVDKKLLCYLPFLLDELKEKDINSFPKFSERQHVVTIGNFLHPPNFDSVLYLKQTIWPLIRKQLPDAEMHIYGAYTPQKAMQLHNETEKFLIKGFATDVNEVMQNAKICLAPLRFGAGLKGKLIDAMCNGTPCVTTTIGAEGMYGNLDINGFIEDDAQHISNVASLLYSNELIWKEKQTHGYTIINKRFQKKHFQTDFLVLMDALKKNLETHRLHNFMGQLLQHHTAQSTKYMSKWIEEKHKN